MTKNNCECDNDVKLEDLHAFYRMSTSNERTMTFSTSPRMFLISV